jgi:signal recognition particle receptor subunit beta
MSTPILPSNRPDPTLPTARGNRLFRRSLSGLVCKVSVLDGLILVGDSQATRAEANIESMHNLYENLEAYGYDLETIPFSIQYNKRDMPNILSVEELRAQINPMGVPDFEGVAIEGKGVFETLSCVSKLVIKTLS